MAAKNLTILAVLFFLSASAFSQTELPTIRVGKATHNVYVIEVNALGKPRHFIVDTGAAVSLFSKSTFASGIVAVGETQVTSMAGDTSIQEIFMKFNIGDKVVQQRAFMGDLSNVSTAAGIQIDGIIGQDVLSKFGRVIFDYKKNTITFE